MPDYLLYIPSLYQEVPITHDHSITLNILIVGNESYNKEELQIFSTMANITNVKNLY